MNDKELLELAAKAAGYEPQGMEDGLMYLFGVQRGWNPLTDDGDALRLAVSLKMEIDISNAGIAVRVPSGLKVIVDLCENSDQTAVTRMAIVSAAAEIGKLTPSAPSTDRGEG